PSGVAARGRCGERRNPATPARLSLSPCGAAAIAGDGLARAWVRGLALINVADSHPLIVPRRKSAVVPTKSILKAANVPIIGGHHVLALQSSPEGWQALFFA